MSTTENWDVIPENCLEFLTNQKTIGCTFTAPKWRRKILRYAESHPDDVHIVYQNEGCVYAKLPISWLKISPKRKGREFTEEERAVSAERLRLAREKRQSGTEERK